MQDNNYYAYNITKFSLCLILQVSWAHNFYQTAIMCIISLKFIFLYRCYYYKVALLVIVWFQLPCCVFHCSHIYFLSHIRCHYIQHGLFQYAVSTMCQMEFRFALTTLKIPVIVVVVGTGYDWEKTEVRIV